MAYPPAFISCTDEELDLDAIPHALEEILNRVLSMYERAGVIAPERRLWGVGIWPVECNELTVTMTDLEADDTDDINCHVPIRLSIRVAVSRCVPVSADKAGTRPPTPRQTALAGELLAKDAWILAKVAPYLDLYQMKNINWNVTVDEPGGGIQTVYLDMRLVI